MSCETEEVVAACGGSEGGEGAGADEGGAGGDGEVGLEGVVGGGRVGVEDDGGAVAVGVGGGSEAVGDVGEVPECEGARGVVWGRPAGVGEGESGLCVEGGAEVVVEGCEVGEEEWEGGGVEEWEDGLGGGVGGEFGGGGEVGVGVVPAGLDGVAEFVEGVLDGGGGRGEAVEGVGDFGAGAEGVAEGPVVTLGRKHEVGEGGVGGVGEEVGDGDERAWEGMEAESAEVSVEGDFEGECGGLGGGHGDDEAGVAAEALEGAELVVDGDLVEGVEAADDEADAVSDLFEGALDAASEVACVVVAVAEFVADVGGDAGASECAAGEGDVGLQGGFAAFVEDFSGGDVLDEGHGWGDGGGGRGGGVWLPLEGESAAVDAGADAEEGDVCAWVEGAFLCGEGEGGGEGGGAAVSEEGEG